MKYAKRIFSMFFLLLAFLIAGNPLKTKAEETVTLTLSQGVYQYDKAYEVLDLVNQERASAGLSPLVMDKDLLNAAMFRAAETNIYFSHTRPNGTTCGTICSKMNGENIAVGQATPQAVMNSWMNSEGHRANILHASYQSIGIGCFTQGGYIFWVQCFGNGTATTVSQPANQTVKPSIQVKTAWINLFFNQSSSISMDEDTPVSLVPYGVNMGWSYASVRLDPSCFTWSNSNPTAVTVDQSGLVKMNIGGTATVTATLKDVPSKSLSIQVEAYHRLINASIPALPDVIYTGNPITPNPEITYNGKVLKCGEDYTISYANNQEDGMATVTFTGCGAYQGTVTRYFRIKKYSIGSANIAAIPTCQYTGSAVTPKPEITYDGERLTEGVDYTLSYTDNIETGYGYVHITGIGAFTGTYSMCFYIQKKSISAATVSDIPNKVYNGKAHTPNPTVTLDGKVLKKDVDYTLTYYNNIQASSMAYVAINGIGLYTDRYHKYFTILPASSSSGSSGSASSGSSGTTSSGSSGTTSTAVVKPAAPVLKAASAYNKVTLTWNAVSGASGYVLYRKTGNGAYKKLKTITSGKTRTYVNTHVTYGQTYYYAIKAYKKGTTLVYGKLSKAVSAKPILSRPVLTLKTTAGKQTLKWTKITGASGYFIYQRIGTGAYKRVKTLSSKYTTYTFRTKRGTLYSYKIIPYRTISGKRKLGTTSLVKKARAL